MIWNCDNFQDETHKIGKICTLSNFHIYFKWLTQNMWYMEATINILIIRYKIFHSKIPFYDFSVYKKITLVHRKVVVFLCMCYSICCCTLSIFDLPLFLFGNHNLLTMLLASLL
jgi:hypothetical protein